MKPPSKETVTEPVTGPIASPKAIHVVNNPDAMLLTSSPLLE